MFWSRRQDINGQKCEVIMKQSPVVPLSFIKRKAKELEKENPNLKHTQALDESAKSFGFTNYKNYQNMYETYKAWLSAELERGADIAMEEQTNKMAEKRWQVSPLFENFKTPVADLINLFKATKHSDEAIQKICEKEESIRKYLELYFLLESLDGDDNYDLVTICPYHIPQKAELHFLKFKYGKDELDEPTDEEVLYIEREFKINCKIMFEHTQEDIAARNDGFFDDCTLSGYFDVTIDKDQNVTEVYFDGIMSDW